jgi:hypothetical protein
VLCLEGWDKKADIKTSTAVLRDGIHIAALLAVPKIQSKIHVRLLNKNKRI